MAFSFKGNEEIIHLTATYCCRIEADGGIEHENGCVKKENFWDVVENSKVERNNDKDTDNPLVIAIFSRKV